MKQVYLDYAAGTPMDSQVLKAMEPYFTEQFYNPSATYLAAQAVRRQVNDARARIATHLGCRPPEVIFTAGATEANNLAIQGIMKNFPDAKVLISAIEHESVLAPARLFNCREVPVDSRGILSPDELERMIDDETALVSIMYVNNELGTLQPLSDIAGIISDVRRERLRAGNKLPLYLHTDAAQAGNFLDMHVARLGVDLLSINGGKIYGPKQSGALYVKAGTQLTPEIVGGGQEYGIRSGTENVAGIVGLAKALDLAQASRTDETKRLTALRQSFEKQLMAKFPQVLVNGAAKRRAPHILSVTFPDVDNERLMMQLDEKGILCAIGSACSAGSGEPSHVLAAIGLGQAEARSTLRFSLGRQTTEKDIDFTIQALADLL